MDGDSLSLIIIFICVVMSAYFSATETAFAMANKVRLKSLSEKGDKKAEKVLQILADYDGMISSILIGNNIVNILGTSLATIFFVKLLGEDIGASVATAVTTIVVLIFGEISPKCVAKEHPEAFARFSVSLLCIVVKILAPFNFVFKQWKRVLAFLFKSGEAQCITEEELITFVEETKNDGTIDEQESDMIKSVIEFSDLVALDVLTPHVDVTSVNIEDSIEHIEAVFIETGYSRVPVYKDTTGNVIGTLYQKDFFSKVLRDGNTIEDIVKPARFITGNKNIRELLRELQNEKNHIAIVIDEFGSMIGIVTMEDILEEIVGDIWDEEDEVIKELVEINGDEYHVLGSANVNVLKNIFELDDSIRVNTVNGWVIERLNALPKKGDKFIHCDYSCEVLTMNGKRIGKLSVKKV